jgi:hypothetical protein
MAQSLIPRCLGFHCKAQVLQIKTYHGFFLTRSNTRANLLVTRTKKHAYKERRKYQNVNSTKTSSFFGDFKLSRNQHSEHTEQTDSTQQLA